MHYDKIIVPADGQPATVNRDGTIDSAVRKAIRAPKLNHATDLKTVEEELEELVPGATLVGTRGFGEAVIRHMDD